MKAMLFDQHMCAKQRLLNFINKKIHLSILHKMVAIEQKAIHHIVTTIIVHRPFEEALLNTFIIMILVITIIREIIARE